MRQCCYEPSFGLTVPPSTQIRSVEWLKVIVQERCDGPLIGWHRSYESEFVRVGHMLMEPLDLPAAERDPHKRNEARIQD